jgi:tetratricopeptide (TPR) repeat protein
MRGAMPLVHHAPSLLLCLGLTACASSPKPEAAAPARPVAVTEEHDHANMPAFTLERLAKGAVLLPDLGAHKRKVTASAEAQAFFDQGLALTYGFNHDEAARSFARAAEIDPACAMCFWGAAYTLGPNYNIPMLPDRSAAAHDAITRAKAVAAETTPVEQALVDALARRYKGPEWIDPVAQQPYNEAYAAAMKEVAARFPDDLDVQVLYAEAAMNVNPWKLWTPEGEPAPGTDEILRVLEAVLARAPEHPGANHYYIHAVEASKNPERAVPAADRLPGLIPGAGHIVHMPAHIYQRVGRYADASEANRNAAEVDLRYLERVKPPGYYPFYLGHNFGFLAYSASMEGRMQESLDAARRATEHIPMDIVCGMPGMDFFLSEPLLVMVRFGRWEDILAAPAPEAKYQVLRALWHHARGMALAGTENVADAKAEHAAIEKIRAEVPEDLLAGLNQGRLVLELAAKILEARIAGVEKHPEAITRWQEAVALEDRLAYNEPADWFYPTRHYLGAALLDAGRAKDAQAVYEEDLRRNPENGWALFGLWQSLRARKQTKAAAAAKSRFDTAWKRADVKLERTAF